MSKLYKITDRYNSGNPKSYMCKICGIDYLHKADSYFKDAERIDKHLIINHPEKCYKCKKCNNLFITQYDKKYHDCNINDQV